MNQKLEALFIEQNLNPEQAFAFLFINIRDFKFINDSLGHQIGDCLLFKVGERLSTVMGEHNFLAHWGSDEFVILILDPALMLSLRKTCGKIMECFQNPYVIEKKSLFISVRMGGAQTPKDSTIKEELIQYADFSMRASKKTVQGEVIFFDKGKYETFLKEVDLISKIEISFKKNEFHYCLQPIVNLDTNAICGVEFLMRWTLKGQCIDTEYFIPLLERAGKNFMLEKWLIDEVFCFAIKHQSIIPKGFKLTFNVSVEQISRSQFYTQLKQAMKKLGAHSFVIEMEITERVFAKDIETINKCLKKIQALGISISLDDFGTGYSSLEYLSSLPINTIKIDKSFTKKCLNKKGLGIVNAVVLLANTLKLDVIVEGIEHREQATIFQKINKETLSVGVYGQGYYFYKPMPPIEAIKTITSMKK